VTSAVHVRRLNVEGYNLDDTYDAFGRLRVAGPLTQIDGKQIYGHNNSLQFNTSGSATYSQNRASTLLTVNGVHTTSARWSRRRLNYRSGKGQEVLITFVNTNGGETGAVKEVGLFGAQNGLFFRQTETGRYMVRRSYVTGVAVDEAVAQADWHDPLDGTGQSTVALDWTTAKILYITFEWLGVGIATLGFIHQGRFLPAYTFNLTPAASVYMSDPNLEVRWQITGDGVNTATLETICCSVTSNGDLEAVGVSRSVDRGVTGIASTSTNLYPVVSTRLATGRNDAVTLTSLSLLCSTTANFYWSLRRNPTITGGAAASWVSAGTESPIEYDVSRTGTVSGGQIMRSGYGSATLDSVDVPVNVYDGWGRNAAGTSDEIVLCVGSLAAAGETFFGGLSWIEPS
jgi:hypothetical protein